MPDSSPHVVQDGFPPSLDLLGQHVAQKMGLNFSVGRRKDLWRAVSNLADEQGHSNVHACIERLLASPLSDRQLEELAAHLTVGETYFFRETRTLDAFKNEVLPDLLKQNAGRGRRLRIWSAGCSSGEEPYTLAIFLHDAVPDSGLWDIRIHGTDINPHVLEKARQGIYTEWSFRATPEALRRRCFQKQGNNRYALDVRFKKRVTFSQYNLASDHDPPFLHEDGPLDVIFCRNVMIYFMPQTIRLLIQRFHRCLNEGGWLVVAPSETSVLLDSDFTATYFPGATLYRKSRKKLVHKGETSKDAKEPFSLPIHHGRSRQASPRGDLHAFAKTEVTFEKKPFSAKPHIQAEPLFPNASPSGRKMSPDGEPEQLYEDALAHYRRGRHAEAEARLQEFFQTRISCSLKTDQEAGACLLTARIQANRGCPDQALQWCEKALNIHKTDPAAFFLQAMILQELGRFKDAAGALRKSLYLDSRFVAAHYALGILALRGGKMMDARRHLRNAVELLDATPLETVLPEMDGTTAGELRKTIRALENQELFV